MCNDRQGKNDNPKNNIGGAVGTILSRKGKPCLSPIASPILKGFFMDTLGTYIYLFRKIRDTSFYKDSYAFHLAIHCLLKANRFPKQVIIGNQAIDLRIGQFVTGRHKLYLETGIAESTIRNKLFLLCKVRFMDIKATTKYSVITVINYEKYQLNLESRTAARPTDRPTSEHNKESIKNIKKEKKEPTALQAVIDFFFSIKDYNKDKEWVKLNYPRNCPAAKRLLALASADEVKTMITKGKAYFEDKNLSWKLETIEKHWNEIKTYKGKITYS